MVGIRHQTNYSTGYGDFLFLFLGKPLTAGSILVIYFSFRVLCVAFVGEPLIAGSTPDFVLFVSSVVVVVVVVVSLFGKPLNAGSSL